MAVKVLSYASSCHIKLWWKVLTKTSVSAIKRVICTFYTQYNGTPAHGWIAHGLQFLCSKSVTTQQWLPHFTDYILRPFPSFTTHSIYSHSMNTEFTRITIPRGKDETLSGHGMYRRASATVFILTWNSLNEYKSICGIICTVIPNVHMHADYVITQGHRSRSGVMDTRPVYYAAWVWLRFGGKLLNCCNFIPSRRCNLKIFLQGHGSRPC